MSASKRLEKKQLGFRKRKMNERRLRPQLRKKPRSKLGKRKRQPKRPKDSRNKRSKLKRKLRKLRRSRKRPRGSA